jgi:Rieske 2Fe-2S family protein
MISSAEITLNSLIARQKPGFTLERPFYSDDVIYRADIARFWRTGWLFVGHSCEIPNPGDYFTLQLDTDPILVTRGDDGAIRALHNVCRHRGSVICSQSSGHANRLVCPYHQWVYGLDGALLSCRGMHEVNKAETSLSPIATEVVGGLIFISVAEQPSDFARARACLEPLLNTQGLERAKVARTLDYRVHANWKLVWENNRECYHCNVNHPQYIKANFDHYNTDDATPQVREAIESAVRKSEQKWAAAGLAPSHKQTGMTVFPDVESDTWFSANRTPLVDGWFSETMEGRQVAPLMGDYTAPDVGTLRMRALPNFWNHSSCDHSVSTRLLPVGPQTTDIRVTWLVDKDAEEGVDYRLEDLLPFWQLTSEQDWEICERQQRGVNSSAYIPGPYSTFKEYNVDGFVRWYLKKLKSSIESAPK